WSFSLRTMFVVVMLAACLLYLLNGSPKYVAIPLLLLFAAIYPTALLFGIIYGREGTRAFCVGAIFPAVGFYFGAMSYFTDVMGRAQPMYGKLISWREIFELVGPHFRPW